MDEKTRFVWDERKNDINVEKHGVDFTDAVRAWFDPNRLETYDEAHSTLEESRWIYRGMSAGVVLFVVETEIADDTVRIISARVATKREKEDYYAHGNVHP